MEVLNINTIMYSYYINTKATEGHAVNAQRRFWIPAHAAMYVVPYALAKLSVIKSPSGLGNYFA